MPIKGDRQYDVGWEGSRRRFVSSGKLELFRQDPEKYAPLYGGYCACRAAAGGLYDFKPEAWSIVDGRLCLDKNLSVRDAWRQDIPGFIEKADANWPGLRVKN